MSTTQPPTKSRLVLAGQFHFSDEVNLKQFFWLPKSLIESQQWAAFSKAAKAVYPVIAAHCNKQGWSHPGQKRIAILSGRTRKVVGEGIRYLEESGIIKLGFYTNKHGKRSHKFSLDLPSSNNKSAFPFHSAILYGGNWRQLKPTAQAVYVAMRYWGFFDLETRDELEGETNEPNDYEEIYRQRHYDFCEAEPSFIMRSAGISRRSFIEALHDLQRHFLVESVNPKLWKVFLVPKRIYSSQFLNGQVARKNYTS